MIRERKKGRKNPRTSPLYFSNNSFSAGATSVHRPAKDGRMVPRDTNSSLSSLLLVVVGRSLVAHTAIPKALTSVVIYIHENNNNNRRYANEKG